MSHTKSNHIETSLGNENHKPRGPTLVGKLPFDFGEREEVIYFRHCVHW